jgi:hypothetical protein
MRTRVVVVLMVFARMSAAAEPCGTEQLSPAASARIAIVVAAHARYIEATTAPGRTEAADAETALAWAYHDLISDPSEVADEALAALVGYYNGESQEVECDVLKRGSRALPHLERFERCPPTIDLPKLDGDFWGGLRSQIVDGKSCDVL